jgi:glycerol uptake facilitator-like aquaporin
MIGALVGVWAAHYMFEIPLLDASRHARTGGPQWLAEAMATFGLLVVIFGSKGRAAYAVGAYITAAYWFTSSTSFANPAVTFARPGRTRLPASVPSTFPPFIVAQVDWRGLGRDSLPVPWRLP